MRRMYGEHDQTLAPFVYLMHTQVDIRIPIMNTYHCTPRAARV